MAANVDNQKYVVSYQIEDYKDADAMDQVYLLRGKYSDLIFYHEFFDETRARNGWTIPKIPIRSPY